MRLSRVNDLDSLALEQFCYLTTTGRVSGRPHTVEIWFARRSGGNTLYILSGGRESADWVKNIDHNPSVTVKLGESVFRGKGRVVTGEAEERLARRLVVIKYYGREPRSTGWDADSLPVAVDLEV